MMPCGCKKHRVSILYTIKFIVNSRTALIDFSLQKNLLVEQKNNNNNKIKLIANYIKLIIRI